MTKSQHNGEKCWVQYKKEGICLDPCKMDSEN